jgi:hypothetical protein
VDRKMQMLIFMAVDTIRDEACRGEEGYVLTYRDEEPAGREGVFVEVEEYGW